MSVLVITSLRASAMRSGRPQSTSGTPPPRILGAMKTRIVSTMPDLSRLEYTPLPPSAMTAWSPMAPRRPRTSGHGMSPASSARMETSRVPVLTNSFHLSSGWRVKIKDPAPRHLDEGSISSRGSRMIRTGSRPPSMRQVSMGLSLMTVPDPTMRPSTLFLSSWTWARDSPELIHRESPVAEAILPSRVMAALRMT
ncbi:MAG: hypothetical protein BWX71_02827 [Deltaproteobacteria bacterium ADurb.Bin072]|nr:MAG: hypothetical protein BWX71_02827 [Deltaproteobacteria bacterium ADurb.Bin072]